VFVFEVWRGRRRIWLAGMERPEALLAAVMQLESRSSGARLADVILHLKICLEERDDAFSVTGLWLDGADFDREKYETFY